MQPEPEALPVGAKDECRFCGLGVVWEPWFLDGKQPNPPVWAHVHSGTRSCSTLPDGWRGNRWPFAEPPPSNEAP